MTETEGTTGVVEQNKQHKLVEPEVGVKQDDLSLTAEIEEELKTYACCGRIKLAKGVTSTNFWGLMFVAFSTIGYLVYLSAMQSFLLTAVYDVDTDNLGRVTGILGVSDEIWSIITLGFWGAVSEYIGRRSVVVAGFVHIFIGCLLIPNGNTLYPGLLLSRLVYAQGASALSSMLSALLADYIEKSDMGKATGVLGLFSGFGALFSVFVLVTELPPNICIANTYYVTGLIALGCAIFSFFSLQKLSVLRTEQNIQIPEEKNPLILLIEGYKFARKNRHLALAYFAGFLARGDSIVTSVFVPLWVNKYYDDNELCFEENSTEFSTCDENLANEDEETCPDAYTSFRIISGVAQVVALICTPFFGIFADKISSVNMVIFVAALGVISYFFSFFTEDPDAGFSIIVACLWYVSGNGMVIAAQVQLVKNLGPDLRGVGAGFYSLVGALGVMFFTYVGGLTFDYWFNTAPFALAGIFSLLICIAGIYVKKKDSEEE
eukprot:snap_masked-scaffold_3-processed-gene-13.7-mRNA-1 protein AED:1.00 eAED:1.00 QI:0/-1/0/0/-1/1/1/0/490